MAEISGKVRVVEDKKKKEVIVTSNDDSKTYTIPFGAKLKVMDGDEIEAGDPITTGSLNPNDILKELKNSKIKLLADNVQILNDLGHGLDAAVDPD